MPMLRRHFIFSINMRLHVLFMSIEKWWCLAFSFSCTYSEKGEKFAEIYPSSHIWFLFLFTFNDAIWERGKAENLGWNLWEWLKCAALSHGIHIFIIFARLPYICFNHVCSYMYTSISSISSLTYLHWLRSTSNENIFVWIIRNDHRGGRDMGRNLILNH